jgi:hypothetical protein
MFYAWLLPRQFFLGMSHATHAPLIPPPSSIYNKKIGFKEKVVSDAIFFKENGETKGG